MHISPIRTSAQHKEALAAIQDRRDAQPASAAADQLDVLTDLVELYELKNRPITDEKKTPSLDGINVRYFHWHPDDDEAPTVSECSEEIFREECDNGGAITYERHTVRENGVSQICFTVNAYE